jgi:ABC-type branched-subunit amino acid transport system ATPase component
MATTTSPPMIETHHLSKTFHARGRPAQAVRDGTLTVRAGTIFGFRGPNGAGKTTAKAYLQLQRQREDCARKQAGALISSRDLIALEDLQVRNLVRTR